MSYGDKLVIKSAPVMWYFIPYGTTAVLLYYIVPKSGGPLPTGHRLGSVQKVYYVGKRRRWSGLSNLRNESTDKRSNETS